MSTATLSLPNGAQLAPSSFADYNQMATIGHDLILISGSFTVEDTGPTVEDVKGFGATPTYSAAGVYLLTLDDKYPGVICCVATLNGAAVANAERGQSYWAYDQATGVVTLTFVTDGDGVAGALTDESGVSYTLVVQRKSVNGVV